MSPNLYDLLDVDPTASTEEIREAWAEAIADLGPTDRRFRAYTDAASVLMDPDRRAAYDAELAAAQEPAAAEPTAEEATDGHEGAGETAPEERAASGEDETAGPDEDDDDDEATATEEREDEASAGPGDLAGAAPAATRPASTGTAMLASRPPQWVVATVAAVAVVVIATTAWVLTWPGTFGTAPDARSAQQERAAESIAAAERIAPQVLSYDHRDMGDDRLAELQELMTPSYAEEWVGVQEGLREQAQQQEAVVTAAVRGSAISGLSDDGGQSEVLVFVDQLVQKGGEDDSELTMWATLRLIRDGETWQLEKICTTDPECG